MALAEVSYWGLIGAVVPLSYATFRKGARYCNPGVVIMMLYGPASALCGAAACMFVSSQRHRMILAPLANLAAMHFSLFYLPK
jgi:hypothetical protein